MFRAVIWVGTLSIMCVIGILSPTSHQWLSFLSPLGHLFPSPDPAMADQFIPATRTPVIPVPIWVLYVGPLVCLIIAAVMLWRCHAAGKCVLHRHVGYKTLERRL